MTLKPWLTSMPGKHVFWCLLLVLAGSLAASSAMADAQTAARLRDKALADDTAFSILESLTTEVGPRPAGSPNALRARDWGVAKLKALGFQNVHIEPFAKSAWVRGAEVGEIIGPFPQRLALLALGNSVPTPPGGIIAPVVVFESVAALKAATADGCVGKIVLVNQPMRRTRDGEGYAEAKGARLAAQLAASHGAVAYLVRSISTSTGRAPHTGSMPAGVPIPAAAISVPDAELIARMAARGVVTVHLALTSHVENTTAWNVSGDIQGSDPTGGVIVIGGHLDSWDPGTGAIDDGAGIAITVAAAILVGESHPRRTIRVVMWGSEETGGAGDAYLAAHKNDLGGIVIAGESDAGADNVYALRLPDGAWALPEMKPLKTLLLPLKVAFTEKAADEGGTDVRALHNAGVPVLSLEQDVSRYFDYHHSADDTLEVVDPAQLRQNVAAWAATLEIIGDSKVNFRGK